MTRKEKKDELVSLFAVGAICIGDLIDECFEFGSHHPRWISVEDELPPKESEYEDNSIVVLATDGNGVYKGLYRRDEYLSGWFTCDLWALDNITHWMPLPSIEGIRGNQGKISPNEKGGEE